MYPLTRSLIGLQSEIPGSVSLKPFFLGELQASGPFTLILSIINLKQKLKVILKNSILLARYTLT